MKAEAAEVGTNFELHHILGARAVVGGLCVLNDEEITFSAATQLVIENVTTGSQRFIESGEITAMAVNHSRDLIGVAEKGTGVVKFYESSTLLCKRKLSDKRTSGRRDKQGSNSSEILFISISKDSTRCLVLSGPPDFTLTMWDIHMDKSAAFASVRLSSITKKEIIRADVCPANNTLVSILGKKIIRLFHVTTKNGKFLPVKTNLKMDSPDFSTQVWLAPEELVLGTETGGLVIIGEEKEAKQILKVDHAVTSLAACPRGFAVGCCQGSVVLFQRTHKRYLYSLIKTVHLRDRSGITSLAVRKFQVHGESLCDAFCFTESRSIVKIPLAACDDDTYEETEIVPSLNQSSRSIDSLIPDSGSLFVDSCTWMPLVAIGGYDGVVRLFNYHANQVVLTHRLDDQICNLSFHPSGKHLLVSTPNAVRLFSVLADRLSVSWQVEDLQQVALVRFSQGGDRFAIALGTVVQVHDLFITENALNLRGHSKPIIDISFRGHKDELMTIGVDCVVCLWDINRGVTKTRTVDVKSPAYLAGCVSSCLVDDKSMDHVYVLSSDCQLKRVNAQREEIESQSTFDASGVNVMAALPSGKIIVSLDDGNIECVSGNSMARQQCFRQNKVTSIQYAKCSSARLMVIAADKAGFVTFHLCGGNSTKSSNYLPYDGISFVSAAEFEEKLGEINSLEGSIQALQSKHVLALDSSNSNQAALKAKVNGEFQAKIERLQLGIAELQDDIESLGTKHKSDMEMLENQHASNLGSAREDCEKKLAKEKKNTEQFIKSCQEKKREFEAQMTLMANEHTATIDKETRTLHELMTCGNNKNDSLVKDIDMIRSHTSELEVRMEEDAEKETVELSATYQKELKLLRRSNTLLRNEKDILQQRHGNMLQDQKELNDQVDSQEDKLCTSEETGKALDCKIEAARAAIIEQDKSILHQERDICSYSQANLEEEHRNSDLVEERLKLEDSLAAEKSKVKQKEKEMEQKKAELKDVSKCEKITRIEMNRLTLKLKQIRTNLGKLQEKRVVKRQLLIDLENGVAEAMNHIDDHKSLKANLCLLSGQFLNDESKRKSRDGGSNAEKLQALDTKIGTMKDLMERKRKTQANEMKRLMREHGVLEKELEDVKKQAKDKIVTSKHKRCHGGPLSDSKLINKG